MTTPPNRSRPATCVLAVATVSALTAASVLATTVPAAAETDTTTTVVQESLTAGSTARTSPTTWTYRDSRTAPFTTLGVSWRTGAKVQPTIEFRTRTDGTWTAWTAAPEIAATPAEAERAGTDPVYVGDSDGVEVRMTTPAGATVADPSVALIDPGDAATPTPQTTMTTRAAGSYLPPKPAVVSRAQWGADESWRCPTPSYTSSIQAAIVHHTAGINGYTKAESAGVVRGIYAYHTKTLGWCDVGYNVLVDKYGTVFEGRAGGLDKPVLGAHATSWNSGTTGVSLMGNYETAAAPAVMMESAAKVIAWKLAPYGRDPKSKVTLAGKTIFRIAGHGDVMSTACPGVNVRSKMPALRDRVAALMTAPVAAPTPTPTPAPAPVTATTVIGKRWQALGGGDGVLGWPLKPEAKVADGSWREFKAHDLFASPRTAAFWTTGAVRTQYRSLGTATSALGFPTSDEKNVPGVTGARMNSFEKGWIIWSSGNGTHALTGSFFATYSKDAALRGRLGAPTSARVTSEFGIPSQTFRGGRLFEVGGTVVVLEGAAFRHHAARTAKDRATIGAPTAGATAVTATVTKTAATVQRMQKGTYVTVGTKAVVVKGSLHGTWREFGAEKGRLGLPTADEKVVSGGWTQTFERGSISRVNGETIIRHR
ncbi:N-acetylmuramoyl-L-alanine amidase [Auraticoccus monumenti]|uniref:LGFP repeat-containing protein n=1 Tax=Auraticoccus monumenti TaxID=675864 RepID=A0A1G6T4K4_9ACTN|nr:N-acetylmuramoyl-L-alanine amidase [Auraticoccus monumenti]SDD24072.1 LGFP repeat-containing protein [Auraticoccus monumenti]